MVSIPYPDLFTVTSFRIREKWQKWTGQNFAGIVFVIGNKSPKKYSFV